MYTIRFQTGAADKRDRIFLALQDRLAKDGRFKANLMCGSLVGRMSANPTIFIKPVRLAKKKPYCGQHPVCDPALDASRQKLDRLITMAIFFSTELTAYNYQADRELL